MRARERAAAVKWVSERSVIITKAKKRLRKMAAIGAAILLDEQHSQSKTKVTRVRRAVKRVTGGWKNSSIYNYVTEGDETTYKDNFRMSKDTFDSITRDIQASNMPFVGRPGCVKGREVAPVKFKLGVCLYILATAASFKTTGDAAGVGKSTVRLWCQQFSRVCMVVLKPKYMPATPPLSV